MTKHHAFVLRHPSVVVRTQASLLSTSFAMHGPNSGDIYSQILNSVRLCTGILSSLEEDQNGKMSIDGTNRRLRTFELDLQRRTVMTCLNLYEVIAGGFDRQRSLVEEAIVNEVSELNNRSCILF